MFEAVFSAPSSSDIAASEIFKADSKLNLSKQICDNASADLAIICPLLSFCRANSCAPKIAAFLL